MDTKVASDFLYHPPETYSYVLPFELSFDHDSSTAWMRKNWQRSIVFSIAYGAVIWLGRQYMKDRPKFSLKGPLTVWNSVLALFSILGTARVLPEFIYALSVHGFQYSICDSSYSEGIPGYWAWMFTLSKVLELGDTVFIVLRKQELLFLHWYHHMSVLIYTWFAYSDHTAAGRWFIVMNFIVHSLMYSYYALRVLHIRLPFWIPFTITTFQLLQMVIGTYIAISSYLIKSRGEYCQQSFESIYFSMLMYLSYFILFAQFFHKAYLNAGGKFRTSPDSKTAAANSKKLA